jgi:carboxypeptidase Q
VVLWTNEENGLRGARQYAADHAAELPRHVAAIEADSGCFKPLGFSLECKDEMRQALAAEQIGGMLKLLAPLGAMSVELGGSGADIGPMRDAGFPLMGFRVEGSTYFDYHHSHADTLDKVNPRDLSECVAVMAASAYLIADLPQPLGRRE